MSRWHWRVELPWYNGSQFDLKWTQALEPFPRRALTTPSAHFTYSYCAVARPIANFMKYQIPVARAKAHPAIFTTCDFT
jgi:hypothetical protein